MSAYKRKRWTREETLLFLNCYAGRKDEFSHSRKKKLAFANVLEDMVSLGFSNVSVTPIALENKLRTLLQAYKCAKDNARQTGAAPCTVPFMAELDELFGRQPIISNTHTLNLGGGPATSLSERRSFKTVSLVREEEPENEGIAEYLEEYEEVETVKTSAAPSPMLNTTSQQPSTSSTASRLRKRKSAREKYLESKLKLKEEFYKDLKELVKNRFEVQEKIEKQKLDLLAKALDKTSQ